ncbi:DNA mismatch repair protein MutS, partial [Candidatus Woesebacteria bacterium]|nr:DNA mismatch repair protein MutS [Candidatus Woesebacteria bacterium]
GKGLVDRRVTRIVTPGTVLDDQSLSEKENNYIMALSFHGNKIGLALADLTTGLFHMEELDEGKRILLEDEIMRIEPSECVLFEEEYNDPDILKRVTHNGSVNINVFGMKKSVKSKAEKLLIDQFGRQFLLIEVAKQKPAVYAAALLLEYLQYTQKGAIAHFKTIIHFARDHHMHLDRATIINLELFSTIRTRETTGSIVQYLDRTATAMGGRKLRDWVKNPLTSRLEIVKRHEGVEELLKGVEARKEIENHLLLTHDIERTMARIALNAGNARDLVSLKESILHVIGIKKYLSAFDSEIISQVSSALSDELGEVAAYIEKFILDEPAFDLKEGGLIKDGVLSKLDTLRYGVGQDKEWLARLEKQEQERTGITALKVKFNKVFGYFIEVSKSNLNHVPPDYIRKQTLVNGERYITPELKEKEESILAAQEKSQEIEYELFCQVRDWIVERAHIIQQAAHAVAILDCLSTFAQIAEDDQFARAEVVENCSIEITAGRHPVVESTFIDKQFVPNNAILDGGVHQITIITGPNMAGKSVFLRQVATIVLLNQIGSFVPAQMAKLPVVDRIFVRSGASDMITDGLSTFMVEMVETAQILDQATSQSLVIMDEIGRGTSTYDGISIAWAVASYLATGKEKPMTLFATHYHELADLQNEFPKQISNAHMSVAGEHGEPVFLYTIQEGAASHSYGVAVAKQAGLPTPVIDHAWEKLHELESGKHPKKKTEKHKNDAEMQGARSELHEKLRRIDLNALTPLDALNILSELKKSV